MRRIARLATIAGLAAIVLAACGGAGDADMASAGVLPSQTVEAGEVTVEVTPLRIDDSGAVFRIAFDTHSVELDLDVIGAARLTVDGTPWADPTWDGDAAGGHHREGTLEFTAAGEPTGTARLDIDGLADPVSTTWELGGA